PARGGLGCGDCAPPPPGGRRAVFCVFPPAARGFPPQNCFWGGAGGGPWGPPRIFAGPPRGQEADELGTLPEPPREHPPIPRHLARNREELPRSEIEASVERLHGVEDLGMGEVRVAQRAPLNAPPVDELAAVEPALLEGLSVHRRARVGRGDRHLDRVRIELAGEADRLRDRLVRL